MHILRIDFENGLHLEFSYHAEAAAQMAAAKMDQAMASGDLVVVEDDVGHMSYVRTHKVQHVMLVDMKAEAAGMFAQASALDRMKREAAQADAAKNAPPAPGLMAPSKPRIATGFLDAAGTGPRRN